MALGCQGFAMTLLVALVFIFDRPFKSRILSPQPIIKAIAEMQNRASSGVDCGFAATQNLHHAHLRPASTA